MDWHDQTAQPAPLTPPTAPLVPPATLAPTAHVEATSPISDRSGLRRTVLTGALAGLLLVGGAVAVVSAASPDPGASTAPSTTADPNDSTTDPDGGTTAPSTRPGHAGGNAADCPDKGTAGSNGSDDSGTSGSPDSSGNSAPAETPAT